MSDDAAELEALRDEVGTVRHELNNSLTSALAEVQLLLMDVESGELRDSYEAIQEALRDMRNLIAAMGRKDRATAPTP